MTKFSKSLLLLFDWRNEFDKNFILPYETGVTISKDFQEVYIFRTQLFQVEFDVNKVCIVSI